MDCAELLKQRIRERLRRIEASGGQAGPDIGITLRFAEEYLSRFELQKPPWAAQLASLEPRPESVEQALSIIG